MKLIYIVEEQDLLPNENLSTELPPVVASTPLSRGASSQTIMSVVGTSALARNVLLGASLTSLPLSLAAAAIIARPLLASALTDYRRNTDSSEWKEIEKSEIQGFLRKNAITEAQAIKNGFIFPPGHPEIGRSYILHPLANLAESGKANVYIPRERYDEILLEEREAELIKMLVTLGAVRISITEKNSNFIKSKLEVQSSVEAKMVSANVTAGASNQTDSNNHNFREFLLTGSDWTKGNKIKKEEFAWVQFEPAWGALITAREIGGCIKAAIELRESSTFSSDKAIAAKINVKVGGAETSVSSNQNSHEEKSYYFEVEFSPQSKV